MHITSQLSETATNFRHVLPESLNHLCYLLVSSMRMILIVPVLLFTAITSTVMFLLSHITWSLRVVVIIIFKSLKILYVAYHFLMMVLNIVSSLLILKTSSIIRKQIRTTTTKLGPEETKGSTRRKRMKEWIKKLDAASTYDGFRSIPIEEPSSDVAQGAGNKARSGRMLDKEKNKMKQSESFDVADIIHPKKVFNNQTHSSELPSPVDDKSELGMVASSLVKTTRRLRELRKEASEATKNTEDGNGNDAASLLKSLLTGVVKRNHLSVNDLLIDDARSVAECGRHKLKLESRQLIYEYNEEVARCLDWLADSPCSHAVGSPPLLSSNTSDTLTESKDSIAMSFKSKRALTEQFAELNDRVALVRKLKQNLGNTALLLSGGGSLALYHVGTIKALLESKVYDDIQVITGASGGSIVAGLCAVLSADEVLKELCVNTCSTNFRMTGEMERENIRWFPRAVDMIKNFFEYNALVDPAEFKKCCNFYYGDMTFEEAFAKTNKHVCITVSASRSNGASGSREQRLLLNHISTPNVTIASAVVASCALPGVMAPAKLYTKNKNGKLELFEEDGVEWVDGSIQADLPFQRIAMLFNVSNYIVCQTNPHIVPFMHKTHHPDFDSFHWKLLKTCEGDIRSRMLHLSRLDLLPKLAGQDISKIFEQKYHGDLTIVPRFPTTHMLGLTVLANPTVEHMNIYIQNGQSAAWPFVRVMQEMLRHECTMKNILSRLQERIRSLGSEYGFHLMVDTVRPCSLTTQSRTISESKAYFLTGDDEEHKILEKKIEELEQENEALKKKLEQTNRVLGIRKSMSSYDEIAEDANNEWDDVMVLPRNFGPAKQNHRTTVAW